MARKVTRRPMVQRKRKTQQPRAPRRPRLTQPRVRLARPKQKPTVRRGAGILGEIGSVAGGLYGMPGLGRMVGNGLARIAGSGAYTLSNPVKSNSLAGTGPPAFGNISGATKIRHREYISDVYSSIAWTVRSYPLQPGMPNLFPWLCNLANAYEEYKLSGFVLEFKSTSSNALNNVNTALGVVGIVTQYDASDPDFTTKQQAENYMGAQSCNPSQSMLHFVECARGSQVMNNQFVRTGAVPAGTDIKFYDMGKINLFTQGMQAADINIGELWVSYDVELFKPKLPTLTTVGSGIWSYIRGTGHTGNYAFGTGGVNTYPLNGYNLSLNNNTLTFPKGFPPGRYFIEVDWRINSGQVAYLAPTVATMPATITLWTLFLPGNSWQASPSLSSSSNTASMTFGINVAAALEASADIVFTGNFQTMNFDFTLLVTSLPTSVAAIEPEIESRLQLEQNAADMTNKFDIIMEYLKSLKMEIPKLLSSSEDEIIDI